MLLLLAFGHENLISVGAGSRIDFVVPGILALAVMSTAFTSQAIGTGFERRYGVLKRLGASPLSRSGLIAAKTVTVLAVEVVQVAWCSRSAPCSAGSPVASPAAVLWVPLLLLAGTAAFSGLALLMAGTLRAEATLAAANLLYLIMLGLGGVLFPLTKFPPAARPVLRLLPAGALADGLRAVLAARRRPAGPGPARAVRLGGGRDRRGGSHVPVGVAVRDRPAPQVRAAPASLLVFAGIISVQLGAGLAGGCCGARPGRGDRAAAVVVGADRRRLRRPGARPDAAGRRGRPSLARSGRRQSRSASCSAS